MRNFKLLLLALVVVAFASCKKNEAPNQTSTSKYVKAIAGTFIAKEGDATFKAQPNSPVGDGREFMVLRHPLTTPNTGIWEPVDGTEFIAGSTAYNDWRQGLALTPQFVWKFGMTQQINNTYCPVEPLRFVVKTMQGTTPAYLGLYDCTPAANLFPVYIYCKRLGDVLTINRAGLQIPNYNFVIRVQSKFSTIDVNKTVQLSAPTTADPANWAVLQFSGAQTDLDYTAPAYDPNTPDMIVYNGLDKKIVDPIVITITDAANNVRVTQTFPALPFGQRYAFTLETKDKGWFNSGVDTPVTDNDIVINATAVPVNANNF
jgi:hypothetical protein